MNMNLMRNILTLTILVMLEIFTNFVIFCHRLISYPGKKKYVPILLVLLLNNNVLNDAELINKPLCACGELRCVQGLTPAVPVQHPAANPPHLHLPPLFSQRPTPP